MQEVRKYQFDEDTVEYKDLSLSKCGKIAAALVLDFVNNREIGQNGFDKADFDTKKCTGIVTGCDLTKSVSQVDNWLDITPVIDSFPHLAYQGSDDKSAKYIVLTEHRSKVLL